MPRLLYLCDFMPGADSGGALVIERHLRRLVREGWKVTLTVPTPALRPLGSSLFMLRALPTRKFWWPPATARWPFLLRLRALLWSRAVAADPYWAEPPDAVLTVLWGPAALTAAFVAKAWNTPLAVIVHDLFRELKRPPAETRFLDRMERDVLRRAGRVWTVSDEMRSALSSRTRKDAATTLLPVPDDLSTPADGWLPRFRSPPVVAHAGAFHSYHVPYLSALSRALARIGGTLLVLTPADNPALEELRATGSPFRHQPAFPTSAEALHFLAREASAITIMYPFIPPLPAQAPTGFPSRLLEFSHLGLPMLLAAPQGNPLFNWARRHDWPLLLERMDLSRLDALLSLLGNQEAWQKLSLQMQTLAQTVCYPENIHRQFLAELPRRATRQ